MCRLFGFRSVIQGKVHTSLVEAENALGIQSFNHPDGWGVAYYLSDAPHLIKSEHSAIKDNLFKKVSGVVSSQTVLAHIRKATHGSKTVLNTHPFQYGKWIFAHNGNINNFNTHKKQLLNNIPEDLRRFILGETDSEIIFYYLLSKISEKSDLSSTSINLTQLHQQISTGIEEIIEIIGECTNEKVCDREDRNYLSFIITNGPSMLAYNGGKKLFFSTYKTKCNERDTCSSFSEACENPVKDIPINHLIFSSEPISNENIWKPVEYEQFIGAGPDMILKIF